MPNEVINPFTSLSFNQERLLHELQKWTTEKSILAAAEEHCAISRRQFVNLAVRVQATLHQEDKELASISPPLTSTETAVLALEFLNNRIVRQQIARYTANTQGITKAEAMSGLWEMRKFLNEQYWNRKYQDVFEEKGEPGRIIL